MYTFDEHVNRIPDTDAFYVRSTFDYGQKSLAVSYSDLILVRVPDACSSTSIRRQTARASDVTLLITRMIRKTRLCGTVRHARFGATLAVAAKPDGSSNRWSSRIKNITRRASYSLCPPSRPYAQDPNLSRPTKLRRMLFTLTFISSTSAFRSASCYSSLHWRKRGSCALCLATSLATSRT